MNILSRQIIEEAQKYIGHEEVTANDSPLIRAWLRRVGIRKPSSWCAAFQWCMLDDACKVIGVKNPIKPTASVHRFARRVREVGLWSLEPKPGDLFFHDSGKGLGHSGIVVSLEQEEHWNKDGEQILGARYLETIEGNTNRLGAREGRFCMRKHRPMDYPNLGYLDTSKILKDGIVTS